jgi:FkbM family methyltransferase
VTWRLDSDPAFPLRRLEKLLLMLRFFPRFPRRAGAWPKYEYLKPWIAALEPAAVVDVGANAGQFLHLARRLWPAARIVAIEPSDSLCDRLRAACDGDPRVRIECCAASDRDGEATLYVTRDDQNSSLLRPSANFAIERPGDGLLREATVPTRRLDGLLGGIAGPLFVKIDVQGAELAVLRGAGARLDDVVALIVETPFERAYDGASDFAAIYEFLTGRGFVYEGSLGCLTSRRTGRVWQEDAVFVRAPSGR